ncbi:hypothetical protein V8G54_002138 [Vigna mungo]|uniref:Uncharacterized protein n=1 Tax=Vigna mungo TaxID=3915 RepID=A0AAQ3P932_VIGMU
MVPFLSVLGVGVAFPIPRTDLWCLSRPHSPLGSPSDLTAYYCFGLAIGFGSAIATQPEGVLVGFVFAFPCRFWFEMKAVEASARRRLCVICDEYEGVLRFGCLCVLDASGFLALMVLAVWVASWCKDEEKTNLVRGDGAWTLSSHGGFAYASRVLRSCEENEHGFAMVVVLWHFSMVAMNAKVSDLGKVKDDDECGDNST